MLQQGQHSKSTATFYMKPFNMRACGARGQTLQARSPRTWRLPQGAQLYQNTALSTDEHPKLCRSQLHGQ